MVETEKEKTTYTVTLTEEQARVIIAALEEYFRLRMGQSGQFADDLASLGRDLSPENPKHKEIFDGFIQRRDHLNRIMQAVFQIAFEPDGCTQKTEDMLVAEDIWDAFRVATGRSLWNRAIQSGDEPLPKIIKNNG